MNSDTFYGQLTSNDKNFKGEMNSAETLKGAMTGSGGATDAVKYSKQSLTDEQQKQARDNIGAAAKDELPTTLANPNELTFTGAVTGRYDGSKPLEVKIPTGSESFVFEVSGDAESGYTSTASYTELLAAYNSGQAINCKANVYGDDVICQLFLVDDEGALFSATCANLGVIVDVKPAGVNLELVQVGSGENSPTINHDAIVADVIEQLGAMVLGKVDSENNIIITATLPSGTYTMRYENADGSTTEIGTFTINGLGGDTGGSTTPVYTNLAELASSDWLTNKRINSSKNIVDVTETQSGGKTCVVTNFIPVAGVSKLHIKGLNILDNVSGTTNYGRVYTYNNGTILDVTYQPNTGISSTGKTHYSIADYDNSVVIFDLSAFLVDFNKTNATHIRFGGFLTGTAEDVIITADEKIV